MEELKKYYEKSKNRWLGICAFAWAILTIFFSMIEDVVSKAVIDWGTAQNMVNESYLQSLITFLFAYVAPTTAALISYFSILEYINRKGWKKKFPQYDISGEWAGTISFTKNFNNKKGHECGWETSAKKEKTSVHIEQTCEQIRIKPSAGDNSAWHSILAGFDEKGNLNILYEAEYYENLQEQNFPESRIGYEFLHIDMTGLAPKQKPQRLIGKFRHCLSYDGKPVFIGDVIYERM